MGWFSYLLSEYGGTVAARMKRGVTVAARICTCSLNMVEENMDVLWHSSILYHYQSSRQDSSKCLKIQEMLRNLLPIHSWPNGMRSHLQPTNAPFSLIQLPHEQAPKFHQRTTPQRVAAQTQTKNSCRARGTDTKAMGHEAVSASHGAMRHNSGQLTRTTGQRSMEHKLQGQQQNNGKKTVGKRYLWCTQEWALRPLLVRLTSLTSLSSCTACFVNSGTAWH
jgi:hypothetical protein